MNKKLMIALFVIFSFLTSAKYWEFIGEINWDINADNPTYSEGKMFYDNGEKAVSYYNDDEEVTVNLGQELIVRVRNTSGATIPNGSVISINGATGQTPTVELADANSSPNVIAVATHDISDNAFGYATSFGIVRGLDTSSFSEGSVLYLNPENAGEMIEGDELVNPNTYLFKVGTVTYAHANNGKVLVDIDRQLAYGEISLTNSVSLSGNNGENVTGGTFKIPFNGSGTGWDGDEYTVQYENSTIVLTSSFKFAGTGNPVHNLYINGSFYKQYGVQAIGTTRSSATITIPKEDISKDDKISVHVAAQTGNLLNTVDHFLTINEYGETDAVVSSSSEDNMDTSVVATLANGRGSTGTGVRRFTNVTVNGSDVTYNASATNGDSFTINKTGWYSLAYTDMFGESNNLGLTINSSNLATAPHNLPVDEIVGLETTNGADARGSVSQRVYLTEGDVIRAQVGTTASASSNNKTKLTISRETKNNIVQLPLGGSETPDVYVEVSGNGGQTIASSSNLVWSGEVSDTLNAWDGDEFTAPRDDVYHFDGMVLGNANQAGGWVNLHVNGTYKYRVGYAETGNAANWKFDGSIFLNAGQKISFRHRYSITLSGTPQQHWLVISTKGKVTPQGAIVNQTSLQKYYATETHVGYWGAKKLYQIDYEVPSDITVTGTEIFDAGTGLSLKNAFYAGTDYVITDASYVLSSSYYSRVLYDPSTGKVTSSLAGGAKITAGQHIRLYYTKD